MDKRFLFIGGDKRIAYAADAVSEHYPADRLGLGADCRKPAGRYGCIVLPLPISRDGVHINAPLSEEPLPFELIGQYAADDAVIFCGGKNPVMDKICRERELLCVDYFADEPLTLKNAALTAEAAAAMLAQSTDASLFGSKALITGGGRVAVYTARLLRAFGAEVTLCARSAEQRAKAELERFTAESTEKLAELCRQADFVVNTVPAELFTAEDFAVMKQGAVYMELATLPPEPRNGFAEQCGVKYIHAAGLPGKASPKTAGLLIAQTILASAEQLFPQR